MKKIFEPNQARAGTKKKKEIVTPALKSA